MTKAHTALKGEYRLEIKRHDGTTEHGQWFPNLILDSGLNNLGTSNINQLEYCLVGTGTAVPAISDTTLGARIAWQPRTGNSTHIAPIAPSYEHAATYEYQFAQGAVIGNMSEVGIGEYFDSPLFSRSLIKDATGNPTTLTLTVLDQLTVFYRLTLVPVLTDITGSITLSGTTHTYVGRIAQAQGFWSGYNLGLQSRHNKNGGNFYLSTGSIAAITAAPALDLGNSYAPESPPAYVLGSYSIVHTKIVPPAFSANPISIKSCMLPVGSSGYDGAFYQYEFTPPITKTNTQTLSLSFTVSWGRV